MSKDEEIKKLNERIELLSAYVEQSLGVIANNLCQMDAMNSLYNLNRAYCNLVKNIKDGE